jgi:hypothetical protein
MPSKNKWKLEKLAKHMRTLVIQVRNDDGEWTSLSPQPGTVLNKDNIDDEVKALHRAWPYIKKRTRVVTRDETDRIYDPAAIHPKPEAMAGLVSAMVQLSECNLTEENCASFEVANKRIRRIAIMALNQLEDSISQTSKTKPKEG